MSNDAPLKETAEQAKARRYDWLRKNSDPGPDVVRCVTLEHFDPATGQQRDPVHSHMCFGDRLDEKIDSEMIVAGELCGSCRGTGRLLGRVQFSDRRRPCEMRWLACIDCQESPHDR
jgi:hypothetical protein